jgi:hypothetical protein
VNAFRVLLLSSAAAALAAGCATAPRAPKAAAANAPAAGAASGASFAAIQSRDQAEARERQAYLRNTAWSFPGAEGFYRLITNTSSGVVGEDLTVAAEVGVAINLANQGRVADAQGALARAEARVSEPGASAATRALVTIGRAIEAGQRGARLAGDARKVAFEDSLAASREAVQRLAATEAATATTTARVDADGAVVIGPQDADRFNDTRGPTSTARCWSVGWSRASAPRSCAGTRCTCRRPRSRAWTGWTRRRPRTWRPRRRSPARRPIPAPG